MNVGQQLPNLLQQNPQPFAYPFLSPPNAQNLNYLQALLSQSTQQSSQSSIDTAQMMALDIDSQRGKRSRDDRDNAASF